MNNMQQQSPYEFLRFIPAIGEKHLGIVVIRFERRFIFRFKILPQDNGGYWATTGAMKTGSANGKDKYEPCFSFDSDYEKSQMTEFVLSHAESALKTQNNNVANPFNSQPAQIPIQQQLNQSNAYQQHTQPYQQPNGQSYKGTVNMGQQQQSASVFNDDNIPF